MSKHSGDAKKALKLTLSSGSKIQKIKNHLKNLKSWSQTRSQYLWTFFHFVDIVSHFHSTWVRMEKHQYFWQILVKNWILTLFMPNIEKMKKRSWDRDSGYKTAKFDISIINIKRVIQSQSIACQFILIPFEIAYLWRHV